VLQWWASCARKYSLLPTNCTNPSTSKQSLYWIYLLLRLVLETELCMGLWITLLEGPILTYYNVFIFLLGLYCMYSRTDIMIAFYLHCRDQLTWWLTIIIWSLYIAVCFVVIVYMFFPSISRATDSFETLSIYMFTCLFTLLTMIFALAVHIYLYSQRIEYIQSNEEEVQNIMKQIEQYTETLALMKNSQDQEQRSQSMFTLNFDTSTTNKQKPNTTQSQSQSQLHQRNTFTLPRIDE